MTQTTKETKRNTTNLTREPSVMSMDFQQQLEKRRKNKNDNATKKEKLPNKQPNGKNQQKDKHSTEKQRFGNINCLIM